MTIILHDVVLFFTASPHYIEKQNVFDFDMSENTSIDTLNTTNASLNQQNLSLSSSGNFRPSGISFFFFFEYTCISTQTEQVDAKFSQYAAKIFWRGLQWFILLLFC